MPSRFSKGNWFCGMGGLFGHYLYFAIINLETDKLPYKHPILNATPLWLPIALLNPAMKS